MLSLPAIQDHPCIGVEQLSRSIQFPCTVSTGPNLTILDIRPHRLLQRHHQIVSGPRQRGRLPQHLANIRHSGLAGQTLLLAVNHLSIAVKQLPKLTQTTAAGLRPSPVAAPPKKTGLALRHTG